MHGLPNLKSWFSLRNTAALLKTALFYNEIFLVWQISQRFRIESVSKTLADAHNLTRFSAGEYFIAFCRREDFTTYEYMHIIFVFFLRINLFSGEDSGFYRVWPENHSSCNLSYLSWYV